MDCQLVWLIAGPQTGTAYSRVDLHIVLYVVMIVSLSCPQELPASDLRRFNFFLPFATVSFACLEKVYIVSNVTPRSLGSLSNLTSLPSLLTCGWTFTSLLFGVNKVTVDFSGDTKSSRSLRKAVRAGM